MEVIGPVLAALAAPFTEPGSRTWWGGLVAAGALTLLLRPEVLRPPRLLAALRHPSSLLDAQLLLGRRLLGLLLGGGSTAGGWWLATRAVRLLDARLGIPAVPELPQWLVTALFSLSLFVAWDASRWAVHWLLHRVPWLWAFHQVHHSAELLTPLTFHRVHPVESLLYQLRGTLVTGLLTAVFFWVFRGAARDLSLLGVSALGLAMNTLTGNLRHSALWLRFPAPVERWLISPAQHQLHHSAEPAHRGANLGTWLAIWDRMAGSLLLSGRRPPARFGVPAAERNHGDDLISAWLGPFRDLGRPAAALGLGAALLASGAARAEEPAAEAEEAEPAADDGPLLQLELPEAEGEEILVYAPDGTPRVAGSAHVVDEEELERFEYTNVEQIVARTPGVTTRGEDGYGLRPNIGIRGASSDRSAKLTLMEDGVLLAPGPYAAPAAYYFPMSDRFTAVEIFKGPAAIRFGPQTIGGALNVRTREVPRGPAWYADLSAGLRDTWKAHGWAGTGGDTAGVLAEVVHLRSDGFKELDGGGDTGFDRTEAALKLRLTPPGNTLQLKLGYANETSHETYLGLSLSDYRDSPYRRYAASALGLMQWDRTQAELSWVATPAPGIRVRTVAYHHYLDRSWTKLNAFVDGPDLHDLLQSDPDSGQSAVYMAVLRGEEDSATDELGLLIGTNHRTFHAAGLQSVARWRVYGERASSDLEAGVRLHLDGVHRLHTERAYDMLDGALSPREQPEVTTLDSRAGAAALAAHLYEDLGFGGLHVLPGLRLELVHTTLEVVGEGGPETPVTRATPLPGLGLLYELGGWTDLIGGVHRGFSPVAPGQPEEVLPELSWNYEGGLRFHQRQRQVELIGFFNDYQNITGQCTLSGGCDAEQLDQQYSGGAAWIYGLEAVAGYTLLLPADLSLEADASYAFTRTRFRTGFVSDFPQFGTVEIGDSMPYVPEHQGGAQLALSHPRVELGLGLSARTGMLDEAGTFPVDELDVPPLLLLDAAGSIRLGERLLLYASGTNLTQSTAITSWRPFGARPVAPRQVMIGLKARTSG